LPAVTDSRERGDILGEKKELMGGSRRAARERERGSWAGFLPGLAQPVWAPGAAQLGCALLLSFSFVLIPFSYFLISCFKFCNSYTSLI
jgi:hypothetical protein